MHIKAKLYPYPVLASFNNDYLDSDFDINCEESILDDTIKLVLTPNLNNNGLFKLIKKGDAEFVMHIECSLTSYRHAIRVPYEGCELKLPMDSIEGLIFMCPFIIAKNDISGYTNEKLNSDYDGVSFDFDKGSILALGTEKMLTPEKANDDLDNLPSIFSVVEVKDTTFTESKFNFTGDKIIISLPSTVFRKFIAQNNSNPDAVPVLHSMLLIPALIQALDEVKYSQEYYMYETRRWYMSIQKACSKIGIILDEDAIKNKDTFELAQILMGNATCNGISNLNKIALLGGDIDED